MKIDRNAANQFTVDFSNVTCVGFHGTSSASCSKIESVGLLPQKVFSCDTHQHLLRVSSRLALNTLNYQEWLEMRSVTFALDPVIAVNHVKSGSNGGQGLGHMIELLEGVKRKGIPDEIHFACDVLHQILEIRTAGPAIYAVDLAGLGRRLVSDGGLLQYYWKPEAALPDLSEIGPDRLLARLDVQ